MTGWVYIVTNRRNGTLYTGVTNDLARRVDEHRRGIGSVFARKHGLTRLVWAEAHEMVPLAIAREKQIKKWRRAWKIALIEEVNPDWRDLYSDIVR